MKHICWLYISIDQHVYTINHVKDSCGTLIYHRYMYESKFCHMCRYFEVPQESLTWFMVWTCWSILIYNQQMCFISWSTNFVIAKKNDPMTSAKKLHNITQYLCLVKRKATQCYITLHIILSLPKKPKLKLETQFKRCLHPAKIFFIHWQRGRLVTYWHQYSSFKWFLFECAIIKNKKEK